MGGYSVRLQVLGQFTAIEYYLNNVLHGFKLSTKYDFTTTLNNNVDKSLWEWNIISTFQLFFNF